MKATSLFALVALAAILVILPTSCAVDGNATTSPTPVPEAADTKSNAMVELFTSEGCSSCPPADRLLGIIAANDQRAITLEFHVDYWDSPAWKDKFSSALYSQRQELYGKKFGIDAIYTPQMVVDGTTQFVGGSSRDSRDAIAAATKKPKANVVLKIDGQHLAIDIDDLPGEQASTIYLATAESDLVTKVTGGENGGATLRHSSVVRSLSTVGALAKGDHTSTLSVDIPTDAGWNLDHLRYVVFVQENTSRRIVAVADVAAKE